MHLFLVLAYLYLYVYIKIDMKRELDKLVKATTESDYSGNKTA